MKKNYLKLLALVTSIALTDPNVTASAQSWTGNGYYLVRDTNDIEEDEKLNQTKFDYDLILNKITYRDLCCFYLDTGIDSQDYQWFPFAIYTSADRAINQFDALKYDKFYLPMANAKFKDAYQLVDGKPQLIEDTDILNSLDKNNLAFTLVQNEQIVGYVNGKDMLAMLTPRKKYVIKEKTLLKK